MLRDRLEKIKRELSRFLKSTSISIYASRIPTTELVNKVVSFCELYSGIVFYPYQEQFGRRVARSILENDGEELTALFSRQCIMKGSMIHTRSGEIKKIEEVEGAINTFKEKEVFEIKAKGGYKVYATAEHPIHTNRGWVNVVDLKVGDKVSVLHSWNKFGDGIIPYSFERYVNIHSTENITGKYTMNEELAELVGWLTSDGSFNQGQSIKFTNINTEYLDRVESLVKKYFKDITPKRYAKGKGFDILFTTGEKSRFNSLKTFIRILNYDESGYPKALNYFTKEQVCAYFRGMWAGDGYIHLKKDQKNIEIGLSCGNNYPFADFHRELLNKLGLSGQVKAELMNKNKDGTKFNRIVIGGQRNAIKFRKIIGEILGKEMPNLNYTRMNKLGKLSISNLDKEIFKYSKVISIKSVGKKEVWDIEVPEKGWFICGGIKVHNSGKSETIATIVGGMMILLPKLANMPMFAGDKRLESFKDGVWVGIFAPSQRQAQITYGRMRSRLQSKNAKVVLNDPDFRLYFDCSNGQTVSLSNGSFATAISASEGSNIEGESFKVIISEEAQDISTFKIRKCLTGDTRILLESGEYKSVEDIVRDGKDSLVCYDKEMKNLTSRVPYEFYDNGIQDVYELSLDNGAKVTATLNHKFYTLNKKTRGQKLKFRTVEEIINNLNNDRPLRVGVAEELPYFHEEKDLDYEKGLLMGYFLGDGCTRGGSVQFIGDVITCCRILSLFRKVLKTKDIKMKITNVNREGNVVSVKYSNPKVLKKFFALYEMWDKKSTNKHLPKEVLYSKSFYKGLVESLIETDGSVENIDKKPLISFAGISETLVKQLRELLFRFGVHTTYFTRDNNKEGAFGKGENYPLHFIHIKSGVDVLRFKKEFKLFMKQTRLIKASKYHEDRQSRERSKYYPNTMRFCKVKNIIKRGREKTYCVNMDKDPEGIHNIIVDTNIISGQSIHPMGAAYNATIIKIGTSTTFKGDFYEVIQRNKKRYDNAEINRKSHYEYDCDVVARHNPKYAKYLEKERYRLGEESDEFQMSYKLKWILKKGQFVDIDLFEKKNLETAMGRVFYDITKPHIVGIDVAGKKDATVITVIEVDWDNPVICETKKGDDGVEESYTAFNTYIKDWLEIMGDDYEEQYHEIVDYLSNFRVEKLVVDATKEASLSHRLRANMDFEVIPFIFGTSSKSEMYKHLNVEIKAGRSRVPADDDTKQTREYRKFIKELGELQKTYSGVHMVVSHPPEKNAHDDYPDSWALAVWGSRDATEVSQVTTESKKDVFKNFGNFKKFYSKRNNITARRR